MIVNENDDEGAPSEDGDVANANDDEADEVEATNYKTCCLYNESDEFGICGPFKRDKVQKDGLVFVRNLNRDTDKHFENLRFKEHSIHDRLPWWSERRLIENRVGRPLDDLALLCEKHRNTQGINWKQIQSCGCKHPEVRKGS